MTDSKVYLVTGGTGSLGTALTLHLLKAGHKVRAYARNEHSHETLERAVPVEHRSRLSSLIGAVEDPQRLKIALHGVDYVIHAAAAKVIPLCEYNPIQAIQTNVLGTVNVLTACVEAGIKRAVLVSTDKASAPATLYGATKLTAERLWLNGNRYSAGREPHFVAVRYGNIFASQGSVVHAFANQAQYGHLELTDPQCTRFHWTLDKALLFVLEALHSASPGELWIPKLPSYRLGDFAAAFSRVYKLDAAPVVTGLRLSEKLHESMISPDESSSLKAENDQHFTLEPGVIHCKGGMSYTSGNNTWRLSIEQLEKEIREWASL